MIKLLAIFCFFAQALAQQRPGCKFDVTKIADPQPIVVNAYTYEFLYPPVDNIYPDHSIPLQIGETVIIGCSGGYIDTIFHTTAYATCNEQNRLIVDDQVINFDRLSCSSNTMYPVETDKVCSKDGNSRIVEMGYPLGFSLKFVKTFEICFNYLTRMTTYVKYPMTKAVPYREFNSDDVVEQSYLYNMTGISISRLYATSMKTINEQIGLPANSQKYLSKSMNRIRLATGKEIFYSSQYPAISAATNTVPEWPKECNNWNDVDGAVQHYAIKKELDLDVYTGTGGTITVLHEQTFDDVTLHLHDTEKLKAIPIPGFFWKLAYERYSRQAVVFISVNVPIRNLYEEHIICRDISWQVTWQPWLESTMHNFTCGYSYACTYEEFARAFKDAPVLDVAGILF